MSARRGYPIIGGPLDGLLATEKDMVREQRAVRDYGRWKAGDVISPGGKFSANALQYKAYNRANSYDKVPTRIWIHVGLVAR